LQPNPAEVAVPRPILRLKHNAKPDTFLSSRKFADWKIAAAAMLKERTTATNAEIAQRRAMGSPFTVSRMTAECRRGGRGAEFYRALTAKCKA
jgi:hypothetical protein